MKNSNEEAKTSQVLKKDGGKVIPSYLPVQAKHMVARVMEFGNKVKGYGKNSWKQVDPQRYLEALSRHVDEMIDHVNTYGEDSFELAIDSESGIHHAAMAACNAMFYAQLVIDNVGMVQSERIMFKAWEAFLKAKKAKEAAEAAEKAVNKASTNTNELE